MRFTRVQEALPDASTHGFYEDEVTLRRLKTSRFALLPSIGAIGVIGEDRQVTHIDFYAFPHAEGRIPRLAVNNPFRGKVGDALSFRSGQVSRADVEAGFGRINQGVTNPSSPSAFWQSASPFWYVRSDGIIELNYINRGISFIIRSNVVASFSVYEPVSAASKVGHKGE
jgi:hypothetical protein